MQTENCHRFHQLPGGSGSKESARSAGDRSSIPGLGRSPRKGNGDPLWYSCLETPGKRSLVGCSPWGLKEWDTTERLILSGSHTSSNSISGYKPRRMESRDRLVHLSLQQQYSQEPGRVHGQVRGVHPHSGAQRRHSAAKDGHRASTFRRSVTEQSQRQTESGRGPGLQGGGRLFEGDRVPASRCGGSGLHSNVFHAPRWLRGHTYVVCFTAVRKRENKHTLRAVLVCVPSGAGPTQGQAGQFAVKGHS